MLVLLFILEISKRKALKMTSQLNWSFSELFFRTHPKSKKNAVNQLIKQFWPYCPLNIDRLFTKMNPHLMNQLFCNFRLKRFAHLILRVCYKSSTWFISIIAHETFTAFNSLWIRFTPLAFTKSYTTLQKLQSLADVPSVSYRCFVCFGQCCFRFHVVILDTSEKEHYYNSTQHSFHTGTLAERKHNRLEWVLFFGDITEFSCGMWFPTVWYFHKWRLRVACAVSF